MMTLIDTAIPIISILVLVIMTIIVVRDKNRPIGYRFTDPEDINQDRPLDDDEEENLEDKK